MQEHKTALFHGKAVEVSEKVGALSKVRYEGGDEWDWFWAKNLDLRDTPEPKQKAAKEQADATTNWADLEKYVRSTGCSIWVETTLAYRDTVIEQFESAAGRSITPDEEKSIIVVGNRGCAEWRVRFKTPPAGLLVGYPHDVLARSGQWRINYKDFAIGLISRGMPFGNTVDCSTAAFAVSAA